MSEIIALEASVQRVIDQREEIGWLGSILRFDHAILSVALREKNLGLMKSFAKAADCIGCPDARLTFISTLYRVLKDEAYTEPWELISEDTMRAYTRVTNAISSVALDDYAQPLFNRLICLFLASGERERQLIEHIIRERRIVDVVQVRELLGELVEFGALVDGAL